MLLEETAVAAEHHGRLRAQAQRAHQHILCVADAERTRARQRLGVLAHDPHVGRIERHDGLVVGVSICAPSVRGGSAAPRPPPHPPPAAAEQLLAPAALLARRQPTAFITGPPASLHARRRCNLGTRHRPSSDDHAFHVGNAPHRKRRRARRVRRPGGRAQRLVRHAERVDLHGAAAARRRKGVPRHPSALILEKGAAMVGRPAPQCQQRQCSATARAADPRAHGAGPAAILLASAQPRRPHQPAPAQQEQQFPRRAHQTLVPIPATVGRIQPHPRGARAALPPP